MRNENKETNQGKKAIGESMGSRIVLALIVVAVIVTAAKVIPLVRNRVQTSQYPVIELADLQGMELESLSDGKFSFSYPAEDWEVWEQVTTDYHPLTIFYKGTADDGSTSISVAENDTVVTQLKPELLQVMLDGLKEQAPYMVIKESEMRSMEDTPVFYLEDNMSLTQEGLDMMVDTGAWTEETIEAMGGREALLSNNIASDQIQIYQLKNGKIYVYTGNYTVWVMFIYGTSHRVPIPKLSKHRNPSGRKLICKQNSSHLCPFIIRKLNFISSIALYWGKSNSK